MNSELQEILNDPFEFISRLIIINKDGKKVKLSMSQEQISILEALITGKDTLILKPRQIGSSTIVAAYFFWKIYTSTEPITNALLSHKLKSSKHLLGIYKTFYNNLPKPLQKPLRTINSTCIQFDDSGASIIAESAGGEGGLRSFTCSALTISEFAFSPNPAELLATATSALNNGQLIIESTANYFNDAHHQEIMKAERGLADWNFLFFPWYEHDSYELDIPEEVSVVLTDEESALANKYSLSLDKIYWRRKKIEKIGWEKFTREYPVTVEEAYAQLGDSYFKPKDMENIQILKVDPVEQHTFAKPEQADRYAIGVDVSAGVGRDYSVIYILSKKTNQPVYVFRSNKIVPAQLASKIQDMSVLYNNAKALVESNNMGEVVLTELAHLGFTNFWTNSDGDKWQTNIKTKTQMFETMKKHISSGALYLLDNITVSDIRALTVNEKGYIQIPENLEGHGDSAVALALACVCLDSVKMADKPYLPNWIIQKRTQKTLEHGGVNVQGHRRYK